MLADLHRHLDGSLRPSTVAELAAGLNLPVPPDLAFSPGMGLAAALARFSFTLSLLQSPATVRRIAREMCEDAAEDGVDLLEIRFAPQLHSGRIEEVIDAAMEGAEARAGIILCGLYGENPAVLDALVGAAATRPGVVGIDLAGGPAPFHAHHLTDYAPAFRRAADLGLGRTVHAGEGRPPEEIRVAIEVLGAQRIGHGTTLLDDASVVDLVLNRGVTIEACPTSNMHTGVIPSVAAHPLGEWMSRGVRAVVCTDNTLLSAVTLTEELRRVAEIPDLPPDALAQLQRNARAARFVRA